MFVVVVLVLVFVMVDVEIGVAKGVIVDALLAMVEVLTREGAMLVTKLD